MSIYGHRQFSLFFFPLIETHESGFVFKDKRYGWNDVAGVEIWQEDWPPVGMAVAEYVSRGRVTLKDGKNITINGRAFEKKGETLRSGYLSAFDEVIDLFNSRKKSM